MKMRNSYTCPLELTHDIIRGKWKPIILWQLGKRAASPSALQNDIVGIGQKMLLQQLESCRISEWCKKNSMRAIPLK